MADATKDERNNLRRPVYPKRKCCQFIRFGRALKNELTPFSYRTPCMTQFADNTDERRKKGPRPIQHSGLLV